MPIREAGKIIRELRHNNLLAAGAGRTRTTGSTRPSKTSRSAGASYGPHTLSAARVIVGTKKAAGATKSLTKSISLERTLIQAPKGVAPVLWVKKSQLGLDFGGSVVESTRFPLLDFGWTRFRAPDWSQLPLSGLKLVFKRQPFHVTIGIEIVVPTSVGGRAGVIVVVRHIRCRVLWKESGQRSHGRSVGIAGVDSQVPVVYGGVGHHDRLGWFRESRVIDALIHWSGANRTDLQTREIAEVDVVCVANASVIWIGWTLRDLHVLNVRFQKVVYQVPAGLKFFENGKFPS